MDIDLLNRLRKETESGIQKVFDELEKQSVEFGTDEFNGNNREEFIIKFDGFGIDLNENGEKEIIRVKLGIYLEDKENIWVNSLEPIGDYLTLYDLKGEFIDEFITINKRGIEFEIDFWIETLNKTVPKRYFRRNIPEYTLVSYINHSIFLFQGKDFDGVFVFIKRCLDYLETSENNERIETEYLDKVNSYLETIFYHLKNNDLVNKEKIKKYDIVKRIKTKS
ncbi:hypothetical protein IA57_04050 [Mangrovimonas yunxiaonensis]|uniref:Uncharacterized protein n=1 Tax=Mangrovimonas yunxiaonensis TaxID=1197477 RepID=A0A084TMV6_9FLAO|nr:hypothetical protein [Mangrovimonas yunxiaonensis]KFB02042.1 hypothetical protein IA57_04050 [Mangrovimonas yunxiaonensis]GGH45506.1 hypothetical protein GCM10011364_18970 [Mangrovimonas yunxiaonensis]